MSKKVPDNYSIMYEGQGNNSWPVFEEFKDFKVEYLKAYEIHKNDPTTVEPRPCVGVRAITGEGISTIWQIKSHEQFIELMNKFNSEKLL